MRFLLFIIALSVFIPNTHSQDAFKFDDLPFLGSAVSEVSILDCSSPNVTFIWHCESTSVTTGSPVGCSDGDTTATLFSAAAITNSVVNGSPQDGTFCLCLPTSSDEADFTSASIINGSSGTIIMYVRFSGTYASGAGIVNVLVSASDRLQIFWTTGGAIRLRVNGASATTPDVCSVDTWHKVTAKWRSTGSPNLSIALDSGSAGTEDTDFTAPTGATLQFGETFGVAMLYYIDNIIIYDSYQ